MRPPTAPVCSGCKQIRPRPRRSASTSATSTHCRPTPSLAPSSTTNQYRLRSPMLSPTCASSSASTRALPAAHGLELGPRLILTFVRSRQHNLGPSHGSPNMRTNATSMTSDSHDWSPWQLVMGYLIVAIVFIGLIWAVLAYGQSLSPAVATTATEAFKPVAAHKLSPLYHVLLALVSILLLGRWMGK